MTKGVNSEGGTWWSNVYRACAAMNLNRQDEALLDLETIAVSPALVWEPLLRDSQCFTSLAENARYQNVIAGVRDRKEAYRVGLPSVLAKHGLTDYVAQELRAVAP